VPASGAASQRLNPERKLLAILPGKASACEHPTSSEETMKVDILCEGKAIGYSNLDPIDPPMGVAGGRFVPAPDYEPRLHAYVIDGDDNKLAKSAEILARSDEYGMLACAGVGIEDFNETLQEISVTVLGIAYPEYETVFGAHALYKAYWHNED